MFDWTEGHIFGRIQTGFREQIELRRVHLAGSSAMEMNSHSANRKESCVHSLLIYVSIDLVFLSKSYPLAAIPGFSNRVSVVGSKLVKELK